MQNKSYVSFSLSFRLSFNYALSFLVLLFTIHAQAIPEGPDFSAVYQGTALPYFESHYTQGSFQSYDGLKISYAFAQVPNEKGALVILPGQGESLLKYIEMFYDFRQEGYSVYIIDHRGQGFSQHLLADQFIDHVNDFEDYVRDFEKFMELVVRPQTHSKKYLLGHSMGAQIGIRFLEKNPDVFNAAVFSAPMMMPQTAPFPLSVATALAHLGVQAGHGEHFAPTQKPPNAFNNHIDSTSSSSLDRNLVKNFLMQTYPETMVGGTSYKWVQTTLKACKKSLKTAASVKTPMLILQAGKDKWVRNDAENSFCELAPHCELKSTGPYADSLHDILLEKDFIRDQAFKDLFGFIQQY